MTILIIGLLLLMIAAIMAITPAKIKSDNTTGVICALLIAFLLFGTVLTACGIGIVIFNDLPTAEPCVACGHTN